MNPGSLIPVTHTHTRDWFQSWCSLQSPVSPADALHPSGVLCLPPPYTTNCPSPPTLTISLAFSFAKAQDNTWPPGGSPKYCSMTVFLPLPPSHCGQEKEERSSPLHWKFDEARPCPHGTPNQMEKAVTHTQVYKSECQVVQTSSFGVD